MVEREGEPLAAIVLRDQRAVVMRPLGEKDQAALLAFGVVLPAELVSWAGSTIHKVVRYFVIGFLIAAEKQYVLNR